MLFLLVGMQMVFSEERIKHCELLSEEGECIRKGIDVGISQDCCLSFLLDFSAAGLVIERFAHQLGNALLHSAGNKYRLSSPSQRSRNRLIGET